MIFLIDPNVVAQGCKTYCATYKPCALDFVQPLYGVPGDSV